MSTLIFHRGGGKSLGYPPNCILTLEWAIKYGATAVEYDVICCKDETDYKIAVIEPKLLKQAGLNINNLEWQEVQKINAGNEKYGKCHVANFEELQEIISEETFQQIHIKGENFNIIPTLVSKLTNIKNYALTSFDLNMIRRIKEANADIPVGWIVKPEQEEGNEGATDLTALVSSNPDALPNYTEEELDKILQKAKRNDVNTVILCGPRVRDKKIIDKVKQAGFRSGAWGVGQNIGVAERLISYDIDMFTIDNPEQIIKK